MLLITGKPGHEIVRYLLAFFNHFPPLGFEVPALFYFGDVGLNRLQYRYRFLYPGGEDDVEMGGTNPVAVNFQEVIK